MKKLVLLALLAGISSNAYGSYYPGYTSQNNDQVAYQGSYSYSPDRYDTNGYSYYEQGDDGRGYTQGGGYDQGNWRNNSNRYYYQDSGSYNPGWNNTDSNRYYQGGGSYDRDWSNTNRTQYYNQGGGYENPDRSDSYNYGGGTIRVETQRTNPNYYYNPNSGSGGTLDEQNKQGGGTIRVETKRTDSNYNYNQNSDRNLDDSNQGSYRQGGGSDGSSPATIRRSDSRSSGDTTITPGKFVDNNKNHKSSQTATKAKDTYQNDSDREIAKTIRSKIGDGWFTKGYGDFSIDVNNGAVTLRGTLDKAEDKAKITDTVRKIDGVKSVNNQLVEAGSRSSNY